MSFTIECALPSGGTAFLRPRLSHEATVERRTLAASLLPTKAIRKLQSVADENTDTLAVLAENDVELADALKAQDAVERATIRLVVHHWEGVKGADGDEIAFPGQIGELDEADFTHLFKACEAAIEGGRADPNGGSRP